MVDDLSLEGFFVTFSSTVLNLRLTKSLGSQECSRLKINYYDFSFVRVQHIFVVLIYKQCKEVVKTNNYYCKKVQF